MSASFWLLEVKSRDFSQAEKERNAYKAVQIHKMTTILTKRKNQNQKSQFTMKKIKYIHI